ncbi:hypothetical protein GCM10010145_68170 [Streptomyces ruber]|uniref:Uncharacterized protein n=2 Tax=Streptomyces TaxID=1883 RepID=A0A918EY23_9ACTN|nr:hypothetical protein [Streptomyces ruber]GGQ88995.1 hypothetical protein GCM10010145_68170 [Streptomyces ruber]
MSAEHVSERLIGRYVRGDTGIAADEVWALEARTGLRDHGPAVPLDADVGRGAGSR